MLKYCSIGSGSSGNCHYIGYKDTNILVDAGLSGKRITTGLDDINVDMENIKGIFITHEHSDHIKGAGRSEDTRLNSSHRLESRMPSSA